MLSPLPAFSKEEMRLALPRLASYTRLLQPPNLFVAFADVVAGAAIAGAGHLHVPALAVLAFAAVCLHCGGAILGGAFSATSKDDRIVGRHLRYGFGATLLALALAAALTVNTLALGCAAAIASAVLLYEAGARRHNLFGPVLLALIHGLTLLLGMSVLSESFSQLAYVVAIPTLYVLAVGALRRQPPGAIQAALALVVLLSALTALLSLLQAPQFGQFALPFIALLAFQTLPPFAYALAEADEETLYAAYKAGLLGIIIVDAALAAGFAGPWLGLAVLALRPLVAPIARRWALA